MRCTKHDVILISFCFDIVPLILAGHQFLFCIDLPYRLHVLRILPFLYYSSLHVSHSYLFLSFIDLHLLHFLPCFTYTALPYAALHLFLHFLSHLLLSLPVSQLTLILIFNPPIPLVTSRPSRLSVCFVCGT